MGEFLLKTEFKIQNCFFRLEILFQTLTALNIHFFPVHVFDRFAFKKTKQKNPRNSDLKPFSSGVNKLFKN